MKMGIDDLADWLLGNSLDLFVEHLRSGWLGVGIHHDHPIVGENHCGVGIDLIPRCSAGGIDAVRDRFQFEEIFVGGLCVGCEDAAQVEVLERLDSRCCGPHVSQKLSTRPVCTHVVPPVVEERMGNACIVPSGHKASPPPNLLVQSLTSRLRSRCPTAALRLLLSPLRAAVTSSRWLGGPLMALWDSLQIQTWSGKNIHRIP